MSITLLLISCGNGSSNINSLDESKPLSIGAAQEFSATELALTSMPVSATEESIDDTKQVDNTAVQNFPPNILSTSLEYDDSIEVGEVYEFNVFVDDESPATLTYTAVSDDVDIVTLSTVGVGNFLITAENEGTATITLTVVDNAGLVDSADFNVTVRSETGDQESGIVFESDFSNDDGYLASAVNLWNGGSISPVDPPSGWDGILATGESTVSVVSGEGVGGKNALKLAWDPELGQPTISLGKHLTGDESTGYDEVYVRYHVKLPNKLKIGSSGSGIFYWKWGRLWQNTSIDNTEPNKWTETRENSHYVVWNFSGEVPYTMATASWGENTGNNLHQGSAGGERQRLDYFISGSDQHTAPGYFESVWDINTTNRSGELENNSSQGWHTIEYRFKLATSPFSDDGEFEMWWDGVSQGMYSRLLAGGGAATRSGIPTAKMGSGFNFFVFFDNMAGWNADWEQPGADGFIYVNDVVVSTDYIGHEYVVK